jgi:hypothetical protein
MFHRLALYRVRLFCLRGSRDLCIIEQNKKRLFYFLFVLILTTTSGLSQQLQEPPVIDVMFRGKIFLQGAYNLKTGLMNNTLNTAGILQAYASSQPYNAPEFSNYNGLERVEAGFFSLHPEIVDWVLITLYDPNRPTVKLRRAAFVRQDGVLVDADGVTTAIVFNEVGGGNYYISVQHRNHLGIRSSSLIDFSYGKASFDFTMSGEQAYQSEVYTSTVNAGNIWAMRAGNANVDDNVRSDGPFNDQEQLQGFRNASMSAIIKSQYNPADLNMDGVIKTSGPDNDQNFLLNTLLNGLAGTVYMQQL